jgi:hypothetical protein
MSSDMTTQHAHIHVGGDPHVWTLKEPIDPVEITKSSAPLVLGVQRPFDGTMLLSHKAAACVTLLPSSGQPLNPGRWIYNDIRRPNPFPFLYLPSVSIPATGPVLYQAHAATTPAELQDTITTAMTSAQRTAVPFVADGSVGHVVIDGAALPFAVIVLPGHQPSSRG